MCVHGITAASVTTTRHLLLSFSFAFLPPIIDAGLGSLSACTTRAIVRQIALDSIVRSCLHGDILPVIMGWMEFIPSWSFDRCAYGRTRFSYIYELIMVLAHAWSIEMALGSE